MSCLSIELCMYGRVRGNFTNSVHMADFYFSFIYGHSSFKNKDLLLKFLDALQIKSWKSFVIEFVKKYTIEQKLIQRY